jgi:hypothetical protein
MLRNRLDVAEPDLPFLGVDSSPVGSSLVSWTSALRLAFGVGVGAASAGFGAASTGFGGVASVGFGVKTFFKPDGTFGLFAFGRGA